jgi:hypothetical protein
MLDLTLQRRVLLVVGNGVTLDLVFSHARNELGSWNTGQPLSWNLSTPGMPSVPLLESFPRLARALGAPDVQAARTDFDRFAILSNRVNADRTSGPSFPGAEGGGGDYGYLKTQLRVFLLVAFSQFQAQMERVDLHTWAWVSWLHSMRGRLAEVISLNYEKVIERAIDAAGLLPHMAQPCGPPSPGTVAVYKPHGSIDFEPTGVVISAENMFPFGERWGVQDIDTPVRRVPRSRLLEGRFGSDIVLPAEYSKLGAFQWVRPCYAAMPERFERVRYCVTAGISYWNEDREELDAIMAALPDAAEIVIANPNPPPDLIQRLESIGRPYRVWKHGPEPLR